MNPFDQFLINPILNILVIILKILQTVGMPQALGFSIILLTALVRFALWPLMSSQLKSTQTMAALKPHIQRIKDDHGHDKTRHQQELSKLYKEHGVNPLAGCLPLLLQLPVFFALYQVLFKIVDFNRADFLESINQKIYFPLFHLEKVPDTTFLGFDLSAKPNQWQSIGVLILLIPIITGVLQFIQSKMLAPQTTGVKVQKKESESGDKKDSMEDSLASVQSQMILIMPAMIAFFSYGFPVGLSLYWNTFTIVGIFQQYVIAGPGALSKYLPKKWQKQSLTKT